MTLSEALTNSLTRKCTASPKNKCHHSHLILLCTSNQKGNKAFGFRDSSDVSGEGGGFLTTGHHSIVSQSGGGFAVCRVAFESAVIKTIRNTHLSFLSPLFFSPGCIVPTLLFYQPPEAHVHFDWCFSK